ncbi:MAG: hypothetical protein ACI9SI_001019 [Polaribacter sp.]|jgi:hypothetical protein
MKKGIILIFLLTVFALNSQVKEQRISINFRNVSLVDAFNKIEKKVPFKFFYLKEWLGETKVSGKYKNALVTEVLGHILKKTVLNYYITSDNKIVLTRNRLIHNSLPIGFFKTIKTGVVKVEKDTSIPIVKTVETPKPITFIKKTAVANKGVETIRVGKESKNQSNKSYQLSGYIKNTLTGKPLVNLVIRSLDKNVNAVTNNEGFYTITLKSGENLVELKSIGVIDIRKKIIMYNHGTLSFALEEGSEMLDEVVISASKINDIKSAVTGVTKIEVAKIKNIPLVLGERDILKVATTLPGISTAGEGASGYNVRGGKTDQNLILLDNGVLYNPSHFFGIFSAINPFTTGDVTIYKGSIPTEFGGRLSSVFDIKTKEGNLEKFSLEGSFGPVTSNLTIEAPVIKGKSSIIAGVRGTYSDWILKSLNNASLSKSNASFYDVILKYKHKLSEKDEVSASAYYSKDSYSITSDSLFNYSNRVLSLEWNKRINEKHKMDLIFANSQYEFAIDYNGKSNKNFALNYKVNENHLKLRMHYFYDNKHSFTYGLSSKMYTANPGSLLPKGSGSLISPLTIPEEKGLESALFLSDNYKINDKISLNAGVRYSLFLGLGAGAQREYANDTPKNESTLINTLQYGNNEVYKTYGGPEFRVSGRYLLSPTASIKAGVNNAYQYIHTLSNNTTLSPTDTWKLSDLNIEPQHSVQFSLGYFKNSEDNLYEFSMEGYYKKLDNMLDYKVGAELLLNTAIETEVIQGEGVAYGLEFLIRKTKGKLNGWLGYSYSRSLIKLDSKFNEERVNNGNLFPSNFDKPHDISLVANYKLTKRYSFSANFAYQTGRPVTYPVGKYIFNGTEYVSYSNRNEFRIPDYYRLDIGFNIEGNHKIKKLAHSFWNISIYNVLGRNNPYSVFFVTENNEIKAYKSTIFSVPIPTITYNIKF